jgi:polyvinyl alcohol dehydrogenase (cytochrome)
VYFGDTAANAYALNAETGRVVWTRKVEDHPLARITGSPTLHGGRLYVPVSSYEESQGADPRYECCTFRGSVSALDAATGRVIWKTMMITDPLQRRGTSTAGAALWGPSGSGIWSAPTIDEGRKRLYVATGNAYSAPAHKSSDAVVALDLDSGAIRWMRQITPGDVYLSNCRAGNPNCPETNGPDFDFGSPPVLARAEGRDVLVIGQKSGIAFALDPAHDGEVMWEYRAGQGGVLGGIEWGAAVDGEQRVFRRLDILHRSPAASTPCGSPADSVRGSHRRQRRLCGTGRACSAAQSAAVTAIPGVVFSGSNDGALRAVFDRQRLSAVGIRYEQGLHDRQRRRRRRGASLIGPGPVVAGGMVYMNSDTARSVDGLVTYCSRLAWNKQKD